MIRRKVLMIHSGGIQEPHQGSYDLMIYLRTSLGDGYEVLFPYMPDPEEPAYQTWKKTLAHALTEASDGVILVGHSLGASVILKFLSETSHPPRIAGIFLIATPYWTHKPDWDASEYILQPNFARLLPPVEPIIFYHSKDDEVVPYSHVLKYAAKLPNARVRTFQQQGHLYRKGIPELIEDIKKCMDDKLKNHGI